MSNLENQSQMQDLLQLAKERGYLLTNELNRVLPGSEEGTKELDELFSALERDGIEVFEDAAEAIASTASTETAPHNGFPEEEPASRTARLSNSHCTLPNRPATQFARTCARWVPCRY